VLFSWLLGFGATLAEPALATLAITVEKLSEGTLKKGLIVGSVGVGVGSGIALGVLKIVLKLPLMPMLIAGYTICGLLTIPSSEVSFQGLGFVFQGFGFGCFVAHGTHSLRVSPLAR
jgi:hypothetical protein